MPETLQFLWFKVRQTWPASLIMAVMVAAVTPFAVVNPLLWLFIPVVLAPAIIAIVNWWGGGAYRLYGAEIVCHQDAYVRKRLLKRFIEDEWWNSKWSTWALDHGFDIRSLIGDVTIEIVPNEPTIIIPEVLGYESSDFPDVDKDTAGNQVYGKTFPAARHSYVHVEGALERGVMGHELDLLAVHTVRGDKSEQSDIKWLEERGIK